MRWVPSNSSIRKKRLNIFLLIGKGVCFHGIIHIVIDHAPNWRISGTRYGGDNFNGMLTIENIVDPITAAYLYRVDLQKVEVSDSSADVLLGKVALVFLVGYQVADWYFFKSYIRDELVKIFHDRPP